MLIYLNSLVEISFWMKLVFSVFLCFEHVESARFLFLKTF